MTTRRTKSVQEFNVICSNKRHKIILTDKGQLVLTGHTKEELLREREFSKIGGQSCKCADIYLNWIKGDFSIESLPELFVKERMPTSGQFKILAWRLQRKLKVKRMAMERAFQVKPLSDAETDSKLAEDLALQVRKLLELRGYKLNDYKHGKASSRLRIPLDKDDGENYHDEHAFFISTTGRGGLQLTKRYNQAIFNIPPAMFLNPPVRLIADTVERHHLLRLLTAAGDRNYAACVQTLKDLAEKVRQEVVTVGIWAGDPARGHSLLREVDGGMDLVISYKGLTMHAAKKILEAYQHDARILEKYAKAGQKRMESPNRFPPAPHSGMSKVKKPERVS